VCSIKIIVSDELDPRGRSVDEKLMTCMGVMVGSKAPAAATEVRKEEDLQSLTGCDLSSYFSLLFNIAMIRIVCVARAISLTFPKGIKFLTARRHDLRLSGIEAVV
jgi:hypothetical protein